MAFQTHGQPMYQSQYPYESTSAARGYNGYAYPPQASHAGSPYGMQSNGNNGFVSAPAYDRLGSQDSLSQTGGDYAQLFKFIIIGDEAVGKTCLLLQFTDKRYRTTHQVTVGVEFGSRTVDVQGQKIKLQCWDTAGQDRFRSIIRSYYRGAAAALLVYDITRRDSFEHVREWLHEARENADPELIITLIGNKSDQDKKRQVTYEEGYRFATSYGLDFLETSAVTGRHVDDAFLVTTQKALAKKFQEDRYRGNPMATSAQDNYVQNDYIWGGVQSQRPSQSYSGHAQTLRLTPNGPVNVMQHGAAGGHRGGSAPIQADSCC
ncbi:YPTC4 [Symbiodinium sp. CCMP2592]|nr:YPTC4 [Symbiodinium sp. CCMP2592]